MHFGDRISHPFLGVGVQLRQSIRGCWVEHCYSPLQLFLVGSWINTFFFPGFLDPNIAWSLWQIGVFFFSCAIHWLHSLAHLWQMDRNVRGVANNVEHIIITIMLVYLVKLNWIERGVCMSEGWGVPPMVSFIINLPINFFDFHIWFGRPVFLISHAWVPYLFLKPKA